MTNDLLNPRSSLDLHRPMSADVAPNNIARPRRGGIVTFLGENIPEDHRSTVKAIEDTRAKLAELEIYRAYLERVAHAADIQLEGRSVDT